MTIHHRSHPPRLVLVLWLALAAAALRAEDYAITTYAGVGQTVGSSDGTQGGAPAPTFNNPFGVAIDGAKNLYVTDTFNNTIRKITPSRVVTTLAGTAGTAGATDGTGGAARFNFPVGIAVDSGGNVFVADYKNFTIRRITAAGVVTTYAGEAFRIGSTNGPASSARFFLPYGLAIDSGNNLYVTDSGNHLVRKISADGNVTTLAGSAQQSGSANGTGDAARFNSPWGIAVDGSGNVYVADSENHTIRKITAAGVVTTLAGTAGVSGSADGPAASARFNRPLGVAVDAAGNVYVSDYGNSTIRQISTAAVVTTIAGTAGTYQFIDSVGPAVRFYEPAGLAVDGAALFIADSNNNVIRRGVPASAASLPTITVQPLDQEVAVGQSFALRAAATGSGITYQWLKNTSLVPGATNATLTINSAQQSDSAAYVARIAASGGGTVDSQQANVIVWPVGTGPIQITARPISQQVATGTAVTLSVTASGSNLRYQWLKNGTSIAGATNATYAIASAQAGDAATYTVRITSGETTETATAKLFVGISAGPGFTITQQPASRTVTPGESVSFFVGISGSASVTYRWFRNDTEISGATGATLTIASAQASDAGNYRARITSAGGTVDSETVVLTVGQPLPPPPPPTFSRLANLSILTEVSSDGDAFTMGYVVGGAGTSGSKQILIRAAGPTLGAAPFNIPGVLADPKLELFAGSTKTSENDNWGGSAALSAGFTSVGAFPYVSATSLDAAVLATIAAGDNSVRVSANGNGTGTVIAELYDAMPVGQMTAGTPRLVNVSVLKHLGALLTVGFVIDGNAAKKVLVRAVGPTIGAEPFNVAGAVADPRLSLYSGQTVIAANDNWGGTAELSGAFTQVGAFALPGTSRDAALVATLEPGNYTVQVSGVGDTTGVAIVEVYEIP